MLWGAAALVTLGGNPGAHLVEVARSLGVPAVVDAGDHGATLGEFAGSHAIAAVDGDGGGVVLHS
jgi:phosphoenolpyruvate-protein kinase (PTS system EI component)